MKPITLSDGTTLPKGTHFAVASWPLTMDPNIVPEPDKFDPLRYYRMRQVPSEKNKHLSVSTDKYHLHFGHGVLACPGRFFAILQMKLVLARLLLEYEFKYPDGQGRPRNLSVDEYCLPDPSAKLLIKKLTDKNERVISSFVQS
jgi:ent-kaurene oxidase